MAVGDGTVTPDGVAGRPVEVGITASAGVPARQAQQWLLTMLPAFPVLLLVLRLWHLSRQDLSTMLLLMQYISPLGLLSALLMALVWVLPLAVLATVLLGSLLGVSAPRRFDPERSLLARVTVRIPGWVLGAAVLLALLTWQMRFLPSLLMITIGVLGLRARIRHAADPLLIRVVCLGLPVAAAVGAYLWLAPAISAAFRSGEVAVALLLLLPPVLAIFLTGPIPARVAPALTQGVAVAAALTAPFLLGAIFLGTPVLPMVAVETRTDPADAATTEVSLGRVITVDDRMTTLLAEDGSVHFVRNDQVWSQVLCPDAGQLPYSALRVRGWHVEETALEWSLRRRTPIEVDPRCVGRTLVGDPTTPSSPTTPSGPTAPSSPTAPSGPDAE